MTTPIPPMACECCGNTKRAIDRVHRGAIVEFVCRPCQRKIICPRCSKRRARLVSEPGGAICSPCIRTRERRAAAYWREFEAERAE